MKQSDRRPVGSSGEEVAQVLAGIAEDVMRLALEPPGGEPFDVRHLRRLLAVLEGERAEPVVTLRDAVDACLAGHDSSGPASSGPTTSGPTTSGPASSGPASSCLGRLADAVRATVARPVRLDPGPPHRVLVRPAGSQGPGGPWLGYVLRAGGGTCWLALGWRRRDGASAASALPDGADERYRPGPIETGTGSTGPGATVLLSVEYRAGSLPPLHAMVNDLHAMVILHDVLREDARTTPSRET